MTSAKDIQRAISIVESSHQSHVSWLEWQLRNPDWKKHVLPESPGEPEHHQKCIEDYNHVLKVLRSLND